MERSIRMTFKDVVLKIGSAVVYDLSAVRHLHRKEQARVLRKRCPSSTPGASRYYAFIAFSPIPGFYRSSRKQTASRRGENERSGRKRIGLSPHLISPRCSIGQTREFSWTGPPNSDGHYQLIPFTPPRSPTVGFLTAVTVTATDAHAPRSNSSVEICCGREACRHSRTTGTARCRFGGTTPSAAKKRNSARIATITSRQLSVLVWLLQNK
jgi:hypothetical protein